jgi:hypothetical protein
MSDPQDGHSTAPPRVDARTTITSPSSSISLIINAPRSENMVRSQFEANFDRMLNTKYLGGVRCLEFGQHIVDAG